ncbi:MAG: beta-L-arabinofuranosidase domain-containing protein [Mangrovibacterium sp.]
MNARNKNKFNRRKFILNSAFAGAVTGIAGIFPAFTTSDKNGTALPTVRRSLVPEMMMNGTVSLSKPLLAPCQLGFRIGLARTRMQSYPCNTMDFIMMDVERPANSSRKAHWSTGDMTGRLLEFLSCSEGIDGKNDPRLDELAKRIFAQRQPSGVIGPYALHPLNVPQMDDPFRWAAASKLLPGLLRYYDLTGNKEALKAAEGLAEVLWSVRDRWEEAVRLEQEYIGILQWVTEPFARLYGITKDPRWMEFCGMIKENIRPLEGRQCHSHGYLSTLRGLQVMSLITGDLSWNTLPDQSQKVILEKHLEMPDGCVAEFFPFNSRTEGCSISDWLMLNLNQGLIHGDDTAYDKAERIFWNALAFNQMITGGFGHRRIVSNGYGIDQLMESWWCCTQNAGTGMSEYARHTVTFRNNTIHVNFLTPGTFELPLPGGKWVKVIIQTAYPGKAEATIDAENVPEDIPLKIRVPSCVKVPEVKETRSGENVKVTFAGKIGHRIEQAHPGVILTYGPLVLVPTRTVKAGSYSTPDTSSEKVMEGYDPQSMPPGIPIIQVDGQPDANGFIKFPLCPPDRPLPPWNYWHEGPGSPTWVEGAGVEVGLKFPDGKAFQTRFAPMCYNTSCLSPFETPVVFQDTEK